MATPDNQTASEIETMVMNQLRLPTTNTVELAKVRAVINSVYRDVALKLDWWWLRKRGVLNTPDDHQTGTVSVTLGSTSVTLATAPSTSLGSTGSFQGFSFYTVANTNDGGAVYLVNAHTAGSTALTLDAGYTGATSTAAAFRLYGDTMSLPADVGKMLNVKVFGWPAPMGEITPEDMAYLKSYDKSAGKPRVYTVDDYATTGDPTTQRRITVHPYPDKQYRLEFMYKQQLNTELSGTTQAFMPDEYRQILVYGALARCYPVFLSDVQRGQYYQGLFNDMLNLMAAAHIERTGERPAFQPFDSDRRRLTPRRPLGRTSLGSFFDVWPSQP